MRWPRTGWAEDIRSCHHGTMTNLPDANRLDANLPVSNLLDGCPDRPLADEIFTEILARDGMRIERIVSTGQATPAEAPWDQDHDEWVLLLAGSASLRLDGAADRALRPGDHAFIPARRRHWVLWTDPARPTVWLAVHWPPKPA
ncbi:cupin domain-containing protein [Prosthecomicrobium hirschii]|uniref:cupin domain-containing protein n=1 Tax=Prosthecodimorpha hirschii TaxID=665126 RepID=UPI00221F2378|nr:cupin domain-containing protein [Prosthecomicrobium hirschii]